MSGAGDPLVGRDAELAAFTAVLDRLERGHPEFVALLGEPGIGKTRLLAELGALADARGMLVLSGSASEFERDLPFWVLVDALDEHLRGLAPGRLTGLDDDARAELGHVLPSWPALLVDRGPGRQDQRYRTHGAVRRLLEVLAEPVPLVLLLDDLHWADSGSIELLCSLLRRPPAAPVLLGTAYRPRQVPPRLSDGVERADALTRLDLTGLDLEGVRRLLGPGCDRRVAAALHEVSGGNPFYLRQLAHSRRAVDPDAAVVLADEVPPAVAAALSAELALLDDTTRTVLEGAAVTGDPFVPELAAAAAAVPEVTVTAALDELLRRDLVRVTDVPRRFRFRHPLVRHAVYHSAPAGWRLGAHERAADALARSSAAPATRARHVLVAARRGDTAAVELLRAAGVAAAQRAPGEAARWFRAALDLLPETAHGAAELALETELAGALAATGRLAEARDALVRGIGLVPADAVADRVRLVAECAGLELTLGRHDAAHRRLMAVLAELPPTHTAQAVALLSALTQDSLYRLEYPQAREWAARADAAATRLGDPVAAASAAAWRAVSCAFDGAVDEARAACAAVAPLVDALTDEQLAHLPDPGVNLASAELFVDRYDPAGRHIERVLLAGRSFGRENHFPALFWTGCVRTARGRLPQAAALLDEAAEVARSTGPSTMLGWQLLARSLTATAAGDVDVALATAEESADTMAGPVRSLSSTWAAFAHAAALLLAGEPAAAADLLTAAAGGRDLPALPSPLRPRALEVLTRCGLALDRPLEASDAAAAADACAGESGLPTARAVADRAAAAVSLHEGDPHRAAALALAAARAEGDVGAVVDAAESRVLAARALAAANRTGPASEELQRAAATFDRCGAARRCAAAERELRRLGHRRLHRRTQPGNPGLGGVDALTERELQVARMIVDRRTNAEIAGMLFLSPKTVETHVRNLFTKLGVSSRVEVARVVERSAR
ncbi:AAA family ATPase [Geodermatophilus sp. YIM 151500]|uniref:helix-turn-helix transcriptional regulator n=1 Tax=Geodermatophilus sp. YIM 151500 TaxID=2984531 RepID=UPI0021E38FCD|nr:LuxR family transcriptional regulator [Geodermatophilus sp. YIM 151500]MCV2491791.1 AAA family ATPase [Geodermatophilus sp. YIM 151500]